MIAGAFVVAAMVAVMVAVTVSGLRAQTPAAAPSAGAPPPEEGRVGALIRVYDADYGNLDRFHSAPYSGVRRQAFARLFASWNQTLDGIDFASLDRPGQIDYILFRNLLRHENARLSTDSIRFVEMAELLPFAPQLIALEDDRRALRPVDPAALAGLFDSLAGGVKALTATIDSSGKARHPRTVANRAVDAVSRVREMLADWYKYYNGYDPVFSWWMKAPHAALDSELAAYGEFLRKTLVGIKADDVTTIIGDPIGEAALTEELKAELIVYTPAELIEIAESEMAWCEAEMLKASSDLGYDDDWKRALEHVKTLHVGPGKQPELISELATEAVAFLEERSLLTIPQLAKDSWRMEMMSPEMQKIAPFFLGGEVIRVSYPTDGMSHEEKMMSMRGNNRHFSRATVHHELIPGHHLQGFMNARYRPYRGAFWTPFWTEGWALYWEMRLWDLGFPKSAEDRVGMLFWRMHRCARIIFSLGFHLGRMTPEECVAYLTDRVGHERENATAEVRRSFGGSYSPLYQSAYLLGGLQIRALQRELVGAGRMTEMEFHDAILRNNTMPIEMVRAALTDTPLQSTYTPQWKFGESGGSGGSGEAGTEGR